MSSIASLEKNTSWTAAGGAHRVLQEERGLQEAEERNAIVQEFSWGTKWLSNTAADEEECNSDKKAP